MFFRIPKGPNEKLVSISDSMKNEWRPESLEELQLMKQSETLQKYIPKRFFNELDGIPSSNYIIVRDSPRDNLYNFYVFVEHYFYKISLEFIPLLDTVNAEITKQRNRPSSPEDLTAVFINNEGVKLKYANKGSLTHLIELDRMDTDNSILLRRIFNDYYVKTYPNAYIPRSLFEIPKRGKIVQAKMQFEQKNDFKVRPVLVLSDLEYYHQREYYVLVSYITSKDKDVSRDFVGLDSRDWTVSGNNVRSWVDVFGKKSQALINAKDIIRSDVGFISEEDDRKLEELGVWSRAIDKMIEYERTEFDPVQARLDEIEKFKKSILGDAS